LSEISELANVPDISFIGNMTLAQTEEQLRENYLRLYKAITGKEGELRDADPKTLLIKAIALIEYQTMQFVDAKGKAELLKSSTGDDLDALAALLGITRQPSKKATATERFTLSAARGEATGIPAGTRVRTQNGQYFNTLEYAEIAAGDTYTDATVQAEEAGTGADGILTGVIDTLVDPIPYIASVTNTTVSSGGLDVEDDYSLTERTFLAPNRFSVAGPKGAYEYFVKEWRSDVADVQITSPSACVVAIYLMFADGTIPDASEKASLLSYLDDNIIRPLTDNVVCNDPEEITYNITLTYYIATSNQSEAATIQSAVNTAVSDFQSWQRKLGRDINPTELITRIRQAGAKRVALTAPTDAAITNIQLPKIGTVSVTYGGLEDD
jgi:phage-related baseplate assembly protein